MMDTVTLGGWGLDRAAHLRGDRGALAALAARPGARLVLLRGGDLLVGDGGLARVAMGGAPAAGASPIFLGLDGAEGVWAAAVAGDAEAAEGLAWADLRGVMAALSPRDGELAATARALAGWHASHGFCAACGAATVMAQAGWQRDCPSCGAHHFPRTDPVVIMLVVRGNAVLLGRSPGWPPGMHSLLAGFVEPGETVEAAVRREVWEEAGVRVGPVSYLASQPWPFPASLMLGCRGEALTEAIALDPQEIEAALWVPRERMARIVAGRDADVRAPRAGAIAAHLIAGWLRGELG